MPFRLIRLCLLAVMSTLPLLASAGQAMKTVTIDAGEFQFQPSQVTVEPGQKVRIQLVNHGSLSHNLHLEGDGQTRTIQTDQQDSLTFEAPQSGILQFYCAVPGHKGAGMVGQIVVR